MAILFPVVFPALARVLASGILILLAPCAERYLTGGKTTPWSAVVVLIWSYARMQCVTSSSALPPSILPRRWSWTNLAFCCLLALLTAADTHLEAGLPSSTSDARHPADIWFSRFSSGLPEAWVVSVPYFLRPSAFSSASPVAAVFAEVEIRERSFHDAASQVAASGAFMTGMPEWVWEPEREIKGWDLGLHLLLFHPHHQHGISTSTSSSSTVDTETTTLLHQNILRLSVLEMAYAKIVILGSTEPDDDESYARIRGEIRKGDE